MTTQTMKVFKETALPGTLEAHSIYVVAPTAKPDYVEIYVTSSTGVAKRTINEDDVIALIAAAGGGASELVIVNDIAERNALTPTTIISVYVIDATGDATVQSGGATYLYNPGTSDWIKMSEAESLDVVTTWANISGKPTSSPAAIDSAVSQAHSHSNKTQLDNIGQDAGGNLTYNGSLPHIGWDSVGW